MVAELEKIFYDDGGGFRATYLNDTSGFWHFHPEFELTLNIKSNGTRIIGDSVELFDMYDMVFLAGNIPHCWNHYTRDPDIPEKHGIILHFKLSSLGDSFLSQHEMQRLREFLKKAERGISFCKEDAQKAENCLVHMIHDTGIEKIIGFFNLMKILISSEKWNFICSENYKMAFDERGNKRMSDVYNHIRENYFKPIPLEQVAKIAGMTPVAFCRYFKENCGAGFVEFLNRTRTNKACYLLRETDYQVHEIAEECGFGSISNFNKQFRKTESISPKAYREKFK